MRFPTHIILDVNKSNSSTINQQRLDTYQNSYSTVTMLDNTLTSPKPMDVILRKPRTVKFKQTNRHFVTSLSNNTQTSSNFFNNLFDINFIKREKLYTKLKYSRSPAYDIVSGGVAALFAGFIGFLISEKFGIELVDSGDFYTFFMYVVFLVFSCRPLIKILSQKETIYNFFSIKFLLNYIHTVTILFFRLIKNSMCFLQLPTSTVIKINFLLFTIRNEYITPNIRRLLAFIDFLLTYPNYKK